MKKYACLNSSNVVIQIAELNILAGDSVDGAVAYIQVTDVEGTPGIYPIPSVGEIWNGETLSFS